MKGGFSCLEFPSTRLPSAAPGSFALSDPIDVAVPAHEA
jgi:hypothetical protein